MPKGKYSLAGVLKPMASLAGVLKPKASLAGVLKPKACMAGMLDPPTFSTGDRRRDVSHGDRTGAVVPARDNAQATPRTWSGRSNATAAVVVVVVVVVVAGSRDLGLQS